MSEKILLVNEQAIATLNVFEGFRCDYIRLSGELKKAKKHADGVITSYTEKLHDLEKEAIAKKQEDETVTDALNNLAVREDYAKIESEMWATKDELSRKINKLTDDKKQAYDGMKAFCDKYVTDKCYASYRNNDRDADFVETLRYTVREIGFGKVDTADDKPFQNFAKKVSVQKKAGLKAENEHVVSLNKNAFKLLVVSLICDYVVNVERAYIADGQFHTIG